MRLVLALAVSLFTALPAHSYFFDGNELWKECETKNAFCSGYIVAAIDMHGASLEKEQRLFCPPPEATGRQLRDVILKYFTDNPAERHEPAVFLIIEAMRKAFPCK